MPASKSSIKTKSAGGRSKSLDRFGVIGPILKKVLDPIAEAVPASVRDTIRLRSFGLLKIPMLFFISPTVVEMTDERTVVRVALNRRTQNHLHSMYFGVLAAGADCAGGLMAMRLIEEEASGEISLIFKDFRAEFLKRAEGDVLFTCEDGVAIRKLVLKALETRERENLPVSIVATVPSKLGSEPVAKFILTLSLKAR